MDDQKAFERSYRHRVEVTAEYLLDIAMDRARCDDFEPELFLADVIRKMNAFFKKGDAHENT